MKRRLMAAVAVAALTMVRAQVSQALAGMDEARRWVDREFQPSTLTKEQQLAGNGMVREGGNAVPGHGDQRAVGNDPDARI